MNQPENIMIPTTPVVSPFRYEEKERSKNQYIDKREMFEAVCKYQSTLKQAKLLGLEEPPMSQYLGQCLLDIAHGLARRPNFSGYSFIDDMISDGIMVGLHLMKTFDTSFIGRTGEGNVYSYVSFSMFRAFVHVITKEKKSLEGKYSYINNLELNTASYQDHDSADGGHNNSFITYLQASVDEARSFAETKDQQAAQEPEEVPDVTAKSVKKTKYINLGF